MFKFRLKFHWSLFPRVQLTIFQQWFRWWLGAVKATSHYLNQWWLVYQSIYASLHLNELINSLCWCKDTMFQQLTLYHPVQTDKVMHSILLKVNDCIVREFSLNRINDISILPNEKKKKKMCRTEWAPIYYLTWYICTAEPERVNIGKPRSTILIQKVVITGHELDCNDTLQPSSGITLTCNPEA